MYEDLVPLVVPGFLTARLQIGDTILGLRSLSTNDLGFLRIVAREGGVDWPFHLAAASIWMVDGTPLLESHPYSLRIALNFLRLSHKSAARAVFSQALSFFRRMRAANRMFESFLYEDESRSLWKATNNGTHPVWVQSGIPGVDRLGQNSYQASWVQWNRSEDDRLDDDYSWTLTRMLVSVQSSKSAKKLESRDKARIEAEKTRRSEVQDRAYYRFQGLIDESGAEVNQAAKIYQPRTSAELSDEMRRWVTGEQDFHDQVVSDYKNRVKVEYEAKEAETADMLQKAAARRLLEERTLGATKPMVGYTPAEFAKLRSGTDNPGGKSGAKFIIEANPISRTFDKYLRENPNPGALDVKDGRVVYKAPTPLEQSEEERPTLNDMISRRKPTFHG